MCCCFINHMYTIVISVTIPLINPANPVIFSAERFLVQRCSPCDLQCWPYRQRVWSVACPDPPHLHRLRAGRANATDSWISVCVCSINDELVLQSQPYNKHNPAIKCRYSQIYQIYHPLSSPYILIYMYNIYIYTQLSIVHDKTLKP